MPKRPGSKNSNPLSLSAKTADAVALVAGLLLPLAFSPFDVFPLAIIAPAVLFHVWCDGSPARAAWRGFIFGVGMFGIGVSWVYVSMHNFGNMPAPLAAFATLLFVAILSLYPALLGYVQARFGRREHSLHLVLVLPALWTLFEWWRGWFFTGFPWLNLGYSLIDSPLAGYAPVAGVYGTSLVAALSAGCIAAGLRAPRRPLLWLAPLAAIWIGGLLLERVEWGEPDGAALQATLVQGNVPLREKWNPARRQEILDRYRQMSSEAPPSQLIVWPEAAIPMTLSQVDPAYLASLRELARSRGSDFLIGVIESDIARREFYNSAMVIGAADAIYRKQHLVPFGEYIPFKPVFFWLMSQLQIPMSDLAPSSTPPAPLAAAGRLVGVSVCYEDAFGEELLHALPQATVLVNVSEDAWFGDSLAPHQRLQMARLRARETARPMLRAANTGPSAAIDHRGTIVARSPQFQAQRLTVEVQPMRGSTPYARLGNAAAIVTAAVLLAIGLLRRRRVV